MPAPWRRYEDQWFIDHILPTAGKGKDLSYFELLATDTQEIMEIIYPDSGKCRKYTALMLYQYYYRKYAPHVKRREENLKKFPPTPPDQLGKFGPPLEAIQKYRQSHEIGYGNFYYEPTNSPFYEGPGAPAANTRHQNFAKQSGTNVNEDNDKENGGEGDGFVNPEGQDGSPQRPDLLDDPYSIDPYAGLTLSEISDFENWQYDRRQEAHAAHSHQYRNEIVGNYDEHATGDSGLFIDTRFDEPAYTSGSRVLQDNTRSSLYPNNHSAVYLERVAARDMSNNNSIQESLRGDTQANEHGT